MDIDEINDDLYEHHRIITDPGQSPIRIDKFLMDRLERVTRNKLQNAIKAGAVIVDGKEVKSNYKVKPRQTISILLDKPSAEFEVIPEDIPLNIQYEDDDLLVLYKEPGMVVHPGMGNKNGTLVNALAYYFKNTLPVMEGNDPDRPGLVHRIDKNTSGLLVIAKNDFAMTSLAKQFFDHTIERKYVAIIWGSFDDREGTITGDIGRHPRDRKQMTVVEDGEEGKHAVTHYKVIDDLYYVSLIECQLETGRTHQIRVHMKHMGHPLFNDERYGGDKVVKGTVFSKYKQFVMNCFEMIPRHALHAKSLGFVHPRTKEKMFFDSPMPTDMEEVMNKWRNYVSSRSQDPNERG